MNTIIKNIVAGILSAVLLVAMCQAQPRHHHAPADGVSGATPATGEVQPPHCHSHSGSTDFVSVQACYVPQMGAFVVVDSVDCAVDLLVRRDGQMVRVGRYVTDNLHKRHDVKNIMRPRSVGVEGDKIVFLASAASVVDTSYVGVLSMQPDASGNLPLIGRRAFGCCSYAFKIQHGELIVAGRSPQGYDFNIISLDGGLQSIEEAPTETLHYRVPKQAERIKASDPVGIGLTVVAVVVVFLALLCISLILQGYGKTIMKVQSRRDKAAKPEEAPAAQAGNANKEQEVMAAIAAAVHLYNDELHDEEDTIITIQKVERAWTPWNAKFYNMNQYFNRR